MAIKSSSVEASSAASGDRNRKNHAPLYITIGPQCCGKTTLLKDIDDGLQDVCLDDQLDVYVSIDTQHWLNLLKLNKEKEGESSSTTTLPEELQQQVQGKTLAQRIRNDNPELNLILKRWNGDLSAAEFADALSQHYLNNVQRRNNTGTTTPNVAEVLIPVVEDFLSDNDLQLPAKTDVFCLESLFKPHAKTNQSAIQKAHDMVKAASLEIPLAWGNTNAKAKDFQQVLDIACSTKRPVHFVLCHPTWKLEDEKYNIPWVELSILLSRNLQRLQATGRYIPASSIADCCQRIQDQLIPVSDGCKSHEVEQTLIHQSTLPVRRHEKPLPFRYRLTRERLIQKEYPRPPPQHRHPRRQDQRREHPTSRKDNQFSRGRPPQQQQQQQQQQQRHRHRQDRYGQERQHRGPPQEDRRYDNRRRYNDEDQSRRRGYNDDLRGGGRGDDRRWSQERQPPRGKRGYQDREDGNSHHGDDTNKRHRSG